MRYNLVDNRPQKITVATIDGFRVSNPTDAMIDAAGIGYEYEPVTPPIVTDETKKLEHEYLITGRTIGDLWSIVDKTADELIDMYIAQITAIYNNAETYKNDGKILYPVTNKEYIPRWVFEFYNTALINKDNYFPTAESTIDVAAVDGSTDKMTFTEFVTFYGFLISSYMVTTATQNAEIKTLTDKIKELRAE